MVPLALLLLFVLIDYSETAIRRRSNGRKRPRQRPPCLSEPNTAGSRRTRPESRHGAGGWALTLAACQPSRAPPQDERKYVTSSQDLCCRQRRQERDAKR